MYRINTNEPLWWGLFAAGMGVTAVLLPIHIFIQGLAIPLHWVPPEAYSGPRFHNLLANPIVKLYLFGVISLAFFHWAHRFRYLLFDLGLRGGRGFVAFLCYGAAIAGMLYTGFTLLSLA